MPVIYHITTRGEWQNAIDKGFYEAPSLKDEGFIHCSSDDEQVRGVLKRYFSDRQDLVKLSIDTDRLASRFIYEWSPSTADTFPHIYGRMNLEAVVETTAI